MLLYTRMITHTGISYPDKLMTTAHHLCYIISLLTTILVLHYF